MPEKPEKAAPSKGETDVVSKQNVSEAEYERRRMEAQAKRELQAYLQKHGIQVLISGVVDELLKALPEKPLPFLAKAFVHRLNEDTKGAFSPHREWMPGQWPMTMEEFTKQFMATLETGDLILFSTPYCAAFGNTSRGSTDEEGNIRWEHVGVVYRQDLDKGITLPVSSTPAIEGMANLEAKSKGSDTSSKMKVRASTENIAALPTHGRVGSQISVTSEPEFADDDLSILEAFDSPYRVHVTSLKHRIQEFMNETGPAPRVVGVRRLTISRTEKFLTAIGTAFKLFNAVQETRQGKLNVGKLDENLGSVECCAEMVASLYQRMGILKTVQQEGKAAKEYSCDDFAYWRREDLQKTVIRGQLGPEMIVTGPATWNTGSTAGDGDGRSDHGSVAGHSVAGQSVAGQSVAGHSVAGSHHNSVQPARQTSAE